MYIYKLYNYTVVDTYPVNLSGNSTLYGILGKLSEGQWKDMPGRNNVVTVLLSNYFTCHHKILCIELTC